MACQQRLHWRQRALVCLPGTAMAALADARAPFTTFPSCCVSRPLSFTLSFSLFLSLSLSLSLALSLSRSLCRSVCLSVYLNLHVCGHSQRSMALAFAAAEAYSLKSSSMRWGCFQILSVLACASWLPLHSRSVYGSLCSSAQKGGDSHMSYRHSRPIGCCSAPC